ncbi:MAG: AAA family ATPase [Synergistales bacterium]|nr:AAA family ATPase [Bacteroidales bacterium]MDY6395756.1 AAA family ATPase [Bacteroidales bacterium]MDY6434882.1 AAA family ATPase [Synergistales bacterium]
MQPDFKDIFLKKLGFTPTDDQRDVVSLLESFLFSNHNRLFVLKGYAGTGKTTMMSALIKTLPTFHLYSVLLAPTGRAAKVLSMYSNKKAFTIHKRIYFSHHEDSSFSFRLKENRSKDTIFIIDESSMIGTDNNMFQRNLLDDLMQYIFSGDGCKAIFIGDTAQLPPVGQELSNALDTEYLNSHFNVSTLSFQLTQVVRQALESGILKNASNLRYRLFKENFSLPILKTSELKDVVSISSTDFEEYLRATYKEYGEDEVIVIAKSNYQANSLNNLIRYRLLERETLLEAGDRLMVVKNNYFWLEDDSAMGFIANGDIFRINRVISFEDRFGFNFANVAISFDDYENAVELEVKILLNTLNIEKASLDKEKELELYENVFQYYYKQEHNKVNAKRKTLNDEYFNALQVKFASCLTCHKSQGGGWDAVFVFQSYLQEDSLNKEYFRWLYTAITRAKKQLYLVNFSEEFFKN